MECPILGKTVHAFQCHGEGCPKLEECLKKAEVCEKDE